MPTPPLTPRSSAAPAHTAARRTWRVGRALRCGWVIAQHKWYVLLAGRRLDVPWGLLLRHDLSKFGPWELPAYAQLLADTPGRGPWPDVPQRPAFAIAWTHHQNANPHHWEFWLPRSVHHRGGGVAMAPLPMPRVYAREMVADWLGAARLARGHWPRTRAECPALADLPRMQLHPVSRAHVEDALAEWFGEAPARAVTGAP